MKVIFKTTKLQDSFDKPKIRQKVYGEYSKNIKMRYDLLLAANSLGDVSHNPPPKSCKGCVDIDTPYNEDLCRTCDTNYSNFRTEQ